MSEQQPDLQYARWKWEQDRIIAERYHYKETVYAEWSNKAAIDNANHALRTLILINGGAAIAILAFLGAVISSDTNQFADDIVVVTSPIAWFAWGVALATLGMAFAYFTNYCITTSIQEREHFYEHPYVRETDVSEKWGKWAIGLQVTATALAVSSLGCFLFGMYSVRSAAALLG